MKKRWIPLALGGLLVLAGLAFGVAFPKKADFAENFMAVDAVLSLSLALGLAGTGFIVMFSSRRTLLPAVLGALLLWSVLLNWSLFATINDQREGMANTAEATAGLAKLDLHLLESGKEEDVAKVKKHLADTVEAQNQLALTLRER